MAEPLMVGNSLPTLGITPTASPHLALQRKALVKERDSTKCDCSSWQFTANNCFDFFPCLQS